MNAGTVHNRRTGRAALTLLIAIVALGGGLAGGYWFSQQSTSASLASGATGSTKTMYT